MEDNKVLQDFIKNQTLDMEQIMQTYSSYIYAIIKNNKSDLFTNEDIEEIMADVFFAIWKNHRQLRKDMLIKPYIAGITKNRIKNQYRHYVVQDFVDNDVELVEHAKETEIVVEEKEQNQIIIRTLQESSQEEYSIFMLFYYEGKSIKEIANITNLTENTIKVKLHRIRKKIQKSLKKEGYSYGR